VKLRKILLAAVVLTALLLAAGCGKKAEQPPVAQPITAPVTNPSINIEPLIAEWLASDHSNIQLYPAGRDTCVTCHDGGAFAGKLTQQDQLHREFNVALDCRACHSGYGLEIQKSGVVNLPNQQNFKAGKGALCLSCHNERGVPNINDARRASPHGGSQGGIFSGSGGIRTDGFSYISSPHTGIGDTCIACHMTKTPEGLPSHTFRVDSAEDSCSKCHSGLTDVNRKALGDYDGDGTAKGFQDEVKGLLKILEAAIVEALEGGSFATGGGQVQFKDAKGELIAPADISNEIYQAGYNHVLVKYDGSYGIHNPHYVVQLLQQSYKALTGKDVPGATLK
jgi:formate-dependent nitrite reductase cytochrome c552 subunit